MIIYFFSFFSCESKKSIDGFLLKPILKHCSIFFNGAHKIYPNSKMTLLKNPPIFFLPLNHLFLLFLLLLFFFFFFCTNVLFFWNEFRVRKKEGIWPVISTHLLMCLFSTDLMWNFYDTVSSYIHTTLLLHYILYSFWICDWASLPSLFLFHIFLDILTHLLFHISIIDKT